MGSGAGIGRLSNMTVDFGATDYPMSDGQIASAKGGDILHIPTSIGADAIIYNLPGLREPIRLTGSVLAEIFLGKVTRWDSAPIAELNPRIALPPTNLVVVHRSERIGNDALPDRLPHVGEPGLGGRPRKGLDVNWPLGISFKGNAAVVSAVAARQGAIGYAELAYARRGNVSVAVIRNAAVRSCFRPLSL